MKKTEVLKLQNNRWASFFPDFATPKRLTQQLENFRSTLLQGTNFPIFVVLQDVQTIFVIHLSQQKLKALKMS